MTIISQEKIFPKNVRKEKFQRVLATKKKTAVMIDPINVHSAHLRREIRYSPLAHYFVTDSWGGL